MNPNAVLSDEQKKQRFKKLHKRRQRLLNREAKLKSFTHISKQTFLKESAGNASVQQLQTPKTSQTGSKKSFEEPVTPSGGVDLERIEKQFCGAQNQIR